MMTAKESGIKRKYELYLNCKEYNEKFEEFSTFGVGHNSDGQNIVLTNSDIWLQSAKIVNKSVNIADYAVFFRGATLLEKNSLNKEEYLCFIENLCAHRNLDFKTTVAKLLVAEIPTMTSGSGNPDDEHVVWSQQFEAKEQDIVTSSSVNKERRENRQDEILEFQPNRIFHLVPQTVMDFFSPSQPRRCTYETPSSIFDVEERNKDPAPVSCAETISKNIQETLPQRDPAPVSCAETISKNIQETLPQRMVQQIARIRIKKAQDLIDMLDSMLIDENEEKADKVQIKTCNPAISEEMRVFLNEEVKTSLYQIDVSLGAKGLTPRAKADLNLQREKYVVFSRQYEHSTYILLKDIEDLIELLEFNKKERELLLKEE